MVKKPTYEELEQRVKELEKEAVDRKQVERELRSIEAQKQAILDASIDMIMQYDKDLRIVWANRMAAEVINKSPNSLEGHKCHKIFQHADTPCPGCPCLKALETGNIECEIMYQPAMDIVGETYWENVAVPVKNESGEIYGIVEIARNVTDRMRTEKAMRESEGFSSSLLNNSPNPILVINPDTSVRYVNPALEEITDFSSDELIGKKAPYPWWTEETLHKTRDDFEEAIHKGARRVEELFQKKNGERFWVEMTCTPVKKNGKLKYYLANWVETTERKQAEERVKHLNLVLRAIRGVSQLITKEKDRDRLIKGVCDNLIETRSYYNTWIALFDKSGDLVTTAEAGLGKDFLPMADRLKRGQLTDCAQRALKQSEVVVIEDPLTTCADCPLSRMYADRGAMTIRLDHAGKPYGVLSTSIPIDRFSDEEEQSLLQEVADDIAFALYSTELEEERKRTQEKLLKIEKRVSRVIENIFKFVPEGLLTFTDKLNLFRTNKAFQDIVQKYSAKLNYTEQELTEIIIEQVKNRIINKDYTEIRIPKNKE